MTRKPLLIGLDNPHSHDPRHALYPYPEHMSGGRIVKLIDDVTVDPYTMRMYLRDFRRTNIYPTRRAAEGRGRTKHDLDAFAQIIILADIIDATDVVMFGQRVVDAFNSMYEEELTWLNSLIVAGSPHRRFWALPHPSGRNYWYNDADNRRAAGELLAALRTGQDVRSHKERIPEQYCVNCGQWMCGGTACCDNPKAPQTKEDESCATT